MPELPEVQCVVDTLRPDVVGRRIARVRLHRDDVVQPASVDLIALLRRRTIVDLQRRAKRIVFTLDDGNRLFIHLGMTGQLRTALPGDPLKKHTHLVVDLDSGQQVRFADPRRFGGIHWLGDGPHDADIGPEPLLMRSAVLAQQLAGTKRVVKVALLDQRVIAGIGNIYADESLHASGIHPLTPCVDLDADQIDRLGKSIKAVLRRAIRAGGSTLRDYVDGRGKSGAFQHRHRVYDRAGKPCRTCTTPITRIVVGGRSTCFCERCQTR